jgi:hypothetical protein
MIGTLLSAALAVAFIVAVVWAISTITDRTANNCARIHQLVMTLDTILQSGEEQTRKYVTEGVLTPAQGRRADLYREQQRQVLASADCRSR